MSLNPYALRPAAPSHWPQQLREWAKRCLTSQRVAVPLGDDLALIPELSAVAARDWWIPLHRVLLLNEDAADRDDVRAMHADPAGGFVLIAWPDGSLHTGVPPLREDDFAVLYRHARMQLEFHHSVGFAVGLVEARNGPSALQ